MLTGKYDADGKLIEGTEGTGVVDSYFGKAQDMFNLGLGAFQQAIGTPMFDAEGQPAYQKMQKVMLFMMQMVILPNKCLVVLVDQKRI